MDDKRPFSKSHVLKITSMHVKRDIDKSIRKSFERLQDRPDMNLEILETLDVLHKMRAMIEDFEKYNAHLYKGDK